MKQLTCEMCGSTDLIKQDGIFVCQTCGTKYSVEEAKKMMVEGTVRIDNSHLINNYLTMAETAYSSKNLSEAETYCNKAIEIDPNNYKAWILKGKVVGWASATNNIRLEETVTAFIKAIENYDGDNEEELFSGLLAELKSLTSAMAELLTNHCKKYISKSVEQSLETDIRSIIYQLQRVPQIIKEDELFKIKDDIAVQMTRCAVDAFIDAQVEFGEDQYPSKYDWDRFTEKGNASLCLLVFIIYFNDRYNEANIERCDLFKALSTFVMNSCSYSWNLDYYGNRVYYVDYSYTQEGKNSRQKLIKEFQDLKKEIEDRIAAKKAAENDMHPKS